MLRFNPSPSRLKAGTSTSEAAVLLEDVSGFASFFWSRRQDRVEKRASAVADGRGVLPRLCHLAGAVVDWRSSARVEVDRAVETTERSIARFGVG